MSVGNSVNPPEIRPAKAYDLAAIVELLTGCALPVSDLSVAQLADFFVATVNDRLVGVAGLEPLESVGLLRSLAVAPAYRNGGLGHHLVAACEERAKDLRGISDLYLLTMTATDYFLRRGYREVPRESVPSGVATHPQFLGLCPASARCLGKNLTGHLANNQTKGISMKTLEVFDPAMCCSTGVCGVDVDPVLVQFAADLQWVAGQGVEVKRHNLGQEPQAFAANPAVLKDMEAGMDRLPILVVDGSIVATGAYLSRAQLAQKLDITLVRQDKPHIKIGSGCCTPKSGCC